MMEFFKYLGPVVITMFGTIFVAHRNIQNNNISNSRIKWLTELKNEFSEYNKVLSEIKEVMNENVENNVEYLKVLRKELEKHRVIISMRFKANDIQIYGVEKTIEEYFEKFFSDKCSIQEPDDCEAYMFSYMNAINRYIISQVNIDTTDKMFGEIVINSSTINVIIEVLEQFQLCVAKLEWIKIKKESNFIIFSKKKYSTTKTIEILNANIYEVIGNYLYEQNLEEDDEKENNENPEIERILKEKESVEGKLIGVVKYLDKKYGRLPTSITTSSNKRYIYSMIEPIHPSGKQFFKKREIIKLKSSEKIYLEANFSLDYVDWVARRIARVTDEYNKSLKKE
ncbi:hypothetical protein [Isobaculum melis]|uniref:Uncharacterized protein n=1 Tax=Isobaculum melis TaxID=142588 RepID=A0A1H9QW67_9LACT|nr:hypothetical protein [Isobaculum melis]SER64079.1 hypothetical protein SAMN04488559_102292 [Isobaculum melis]